MEQGSDNSSERQMTRRSSRYLGSAPLRQIASSSALRSYVPAPIRQYARVARPTTPDTSVDWFETPTSHVLKADVPGLTHEDVQLVVEDGRILQISGGKEDSEVVPTRWHRAERSRSKLFLRRIRLPPDADTEWLQGEVVNGVLTITIPKFEVDDDPANGIKLFKMTG
ncbi:hypothetical protein O6H91_05G085100 [Diphasiastrum complanatum]|uniref:Uncharacterized protein n=1 Tax=Diphasiastrum complanatum TaxID=34168 RepID=A0ACC2DR72_DIPCM|nr:hypothetical protein O6H91_05G085100 [Diphasiastrum complanatum]